MHVVQCAQQASVSIGFGGLALMTESRANWRRCAGAPDAGQVQQDLLKQLLNEVHKDWDPTAKDARAVRWKIASHVFNYEL
jgi:hypothetical protein